MQVKFQDFTKYCKKNSEDPKSISEKFSFALRVYVHNINNKKLIIWLIGCNNQLQNWVQNIHNFFDQV